MKNPLESLPTPHAFLCAPLVKSLKNKNNLCLYLRVGVVENCLVGDQVEEVDAVLVEGQDMLPALHRLALTADLQKYRNIDNHLISIE